MGHILLELSKQEKLLYWKNEQICPEMHANEMFAPYNRRHEVSPSPTAHLNASNSAKHEVILKLQITL